MALTDFSAVDEASVSTNFNTALDASLAFVSNNAVGTPATLSGAGAIPITAPIAQWTTTGADAGTLADGTEGQEIKIILVTDGGNGTLTPANAGGYTTITFADAGDSVTLTFTNSAWYITGQGGLTTGPLSA